MRQNTIVGPAAATISAVTLDAIGAVDGPEAVRGRGLVGLGEQVARRVALVALHEPVDRAVERGREQQRLAVRRRAVEQLLHRGQEAHVGHAVGLVDDDHLDLVEVDLAALDEVGEAAGAGDEDVDAAPERLELRAEPGAAVDRGDAELAAATEPLELTAHLRGELAGRDEHEAARTLRAGLADTRDERDAERDGLARTGRGATTEVAAGEAVGHGHGLDVERVDQAARAEGADELGGNAELGEGGAGHGWCISWWIRAADRVSGGWTNPEDTDPERTGSARDAYPLAKMPSAATTTTHSERTSDVADAMMEPWPPPEDRPIDPTPVHTVDLPATPQRDRTIPATAWVEAPAELLALGRDLGHELVAYKRRIGPWLLWRAGPAAKGERALRSRSRPTIRPRSSASDCTRRARAKASDPTVSCTTASARGRRHCATSRRE